jgi:hypothetical protein
MDRDARKKLIEDQYAVMRFWRVYIFVMYGLHYILGIAAVFLSVTLAAKPFKIGSDMENNLAWGLALVTSIIAFITPERIGERYQQAYQTLSVAVTKYLADETYTVDHVVKAYETGRQSFTRSDLPNNLNTKV